MRMKAAIIMPLENKGMCNSARNFALKQPTSYKPTKLLQGYFKGDRWTYILNF